jgi:hypothetical protein
MATLAALPTGDALSFTRLQDLIGLTPGNGPASRTSVALTHHGRAALDVYTETLRSLLNGL